MSSISISRLCRVIVALIGIGGANVLFAAPGDLDGTYGQHGRTIIEIPGFNLQPNSFIQQSDGKTAVIGWREGGGGSTFDWDFVVARLNADGSLDSTFGNGGLSYVNFFSSLDQGVGIVQQPDGKLVVVGVVNGPNCTPCMGVVRMNTDGSLDSGFGGGGKVTVAGTTVPAGVAIGVVMQGDNLVIGGHTLYSDFAFIRLTSNGALDTTFGTSGVTVVDLGPPILMGRMIAQADGKIIAVGSANPTSAIAIKGAVRINADGSLDTSFNGTGMMTTLCDGPCQWNHVAQQADGKLIFTGWGSLPGTGSPLLQQEDSIVERHNLDGSLDTTFGSGGRLTTLFNQAYGQPVQSGERATQSVVDPSGNITVVGRLTGRMYDASGNPTTASWNVAVGRFDSTGAVDTTFGYQGFRTVPFSQSGQSYGVYWEAINRLADAKLMIMGLGVGSTASGATDKVMEFARLSNGSGDPGVIVAGGGGTVTKNIGNVTFTIGRGGGSAGPVSVSFNTVSGTAVAGTDFIPTSGSVQWADGEFGSKLISVSIVNGSTIQTSDRSFQLALSNATGGAALDVSTATTKIVRDDVAPASTITISQTPVTVNESAGSVTLMVTRTGTAPVSVNYFTLNGSAYFGTDYTTVHGILVWGAGDTAPKTITIPILNDAVYKPTRTFVLSLAAPGGGAVFGGNLATINIVDDDPPPQVGFTVTSKTVNEGDGSVTFDIARVGATSQSVSVNYGTANGTATAGSDYQSAAGTLTWAPNDENTKSVTINLIDDSLYEGIQNETFSIDLSDPTGGAIIGASTATANIVDNDPAPKLSFAVSAVTVNEREPSVALTVTRTGASGLIHSVDFYTANGTAKAGADYVAESGTLTWLATDPDTKIITVPILFQRRHEHNETFTVTLSNPTSGALVGRATETVTITEKPRR